MTLEKDHRIFYHWPSAIRVFRYFQQFVYLQLHLIMPNSWCSQFIRVLLNTCKNITIMLQFVVLWKILILFSCSVVVAFLFEIWFWGGGGECNVVPSLKVLTTYLWCWKVLGIILSEICSKKFQKLPLKYPW